LTIVETRQYRNVCYVREGVSKHVGINEIEICCFYEAASTECRSQQVGKLTPLMPEVDKPADD
jgi:hypothetical protein